MQESLGLEMAEGLTIDEISVFLSKVAFDFLVCSLGKKNKFELTGRERLRLALAMRFRKSNWLW